MKKFGSFIIALATIVTLSQAPLAATTNYYTGRTVATTAGTTNVATTTGTTAAAKKAAALKCYDWVGQNGGLIGLDKSDDFSPYTKATCWQVCRIIGNMYKGKISLPYTYVDARNATVGDVCNIISATTEQLGIRVTWSFANKATANNNINIVAVCQMIQMALQATNYSLKPSGWSNFS